MKQAKLNLVGAAATSREFVGKHIATQINPRYGTHTIEVPIGCYNDVTIETLFAKFINAFSGNDGTRVMVEDNRDSDGYRASTTSLTFHLLPPPSAEEVAESSELVDRMKKEQDSADKARRRKKKKEAKAMKKEIEAKEATKSMPDDEPRQPKKAVKSSKRGKTAVKAKKRPTSLSAPPMSKDGLAPLTLSTLLNRKKKS